MCRYNTNGLTVNQQIFADEYLKDRNGARAYKVGYPNVKTEESARACASRLLTVANVAAYIAAQEAAMHDESIADAKEVRRFLTRVMRGQEVEQVPLFVDKGTQELATASPGVNSRIRAAELLGKLMGLFTDQVRVDVLQMPKIIAHDDGSVTFGD